jgi:hypothetical protein
MFWHCAESCEVTLAGSRATVRRGDVRLEMQLPQGLRCELVRGREDTPLGWVSRRFDQRSPTSTLLVQGTISSSARLVTRLEIIVVARSDASKRESLAKIAKGAKEDSGSQNLGELGVLARVNSDPASAPRPASAPSVPRRA